MLRLHLDPKVMTLLLRSTATGSATYIANTLNLPVPATPPSGLPDEAWAQGNHAELAQALAALLDARTVVHVGRTVVAVRPETCAVVTSDRLVHVETVREPALTVVTQVLAREIGDRTTAHLDLGRWTPRGKVAHCIRVDLDDLDGTARALLGALSPQEQHG